LTQKKLVGLSQLICVEIVIAPMVLHMSLGKTMLKDNMFIASQNVSKFGEGAYTGEVSASQLADFGIPWTLVGHSERRSHFGDDDATVAKKTSLALASGIKVILCIGESLE
jgi:triosephosphate isomerase